MHKVYHATQLPLFAMTKVCPACKDEKTLDCFSKDKHCKSGLSCYCKPCNARRTYASMKAHPELLKKVHDRRRLHREYDRKYTQANPLKHAEKQRRRAQLKKETNVSKVDYQAILDRDGYFCYICEQPIDPQGNGNSLLTFDHVKPLAGKGEQKGTHTEDNIKPAHMICNCRKGVRLLSEMTPYQRRGPNNDSDIVRPFPEPEA